MPLDDSTPDLPEPTATGNLAKTPLAHLLIYAHDRELTGTFDFAGPTGQSATILFIEGQPTKARTTEAQVYLGRVLFEIGVLTEEQLEGLLPRLLASKELHGQILLEEGLITEEQLELGLRAQLVRQMKTLVRLPPETTYKYYDCFDGLASYGGDGHVGIDPFPVVWACIRDEPPWEHVQVGLQRIGASGLRLADAAETTRFAFEKAERATVDLLRQQAWRLHELTAEATLAPRLVQLLAYCLLVTKQVELVRESKIPGAPPSEDPIPEPPPSSPFSGNLIEPAPRKVARVQLEKRPVTRVPIVVEEQSSAGVASEDSDGRTSYVATQPRSFTKKRTRPDNPVVSVPAVAAAVDAGAAAPAPVVESPPPVSSDSSPDVNEAETAPAPPVAPVTAEGKATEGITAPPPPIADKPAAGSNIFYIPTPPLGILKTAEPEAEPEAEPDTHADSDTETRSEADSGSEPVAEVHTRPTVPKMKAVTTDQIAAHLAEQTARMEDAKAKALVVAKAKAEAEAKAKSPRPPEARPPISGPRAPVPAPQSLTIVTPVSSPVLDDKPSPARPSAVPDSAPRSRPVSSRTPPSPRPQSSLASASGGPTSQPQSAPRSRAPVSSSPPEAVAPTSAPAKSKPPQAAPQAPPISIEEFEDEPEEEDEPPPSSRASLAAQRAMQMTADLVARKKEIQDKATVLDKEDYYAVLGITRETPTAEIQKAFFGLAKKWHPDRVPPALADVKELCAKVFAKMSEAHQTLMDPAKRAQYDSKGKPGGDDSPEAQAQVIAILEAATNFQKAEICLKRNDFKQAEELCKKAIAVEPKQADYIAMMAWLQSQKPTKQDAMSTQDQVQELTRAIGISQACERAFFYRAMLYKRLGQESNAIKDFKRAMDLNPRNVDAQREVRLYNMRGGDKGGPAKKDEGGGIFGKLFKKS